MELRCPMCRKKVNFTAKKCPHCLTMLDNNPEFKATQNITLWLTLACAAAVAFWWFF